jgi:S1-C subfamily serine protease
MNDPMTPVGSRFNASKLLGLVLMFVLGYAVAHWFAHWQERPLLDAQAQPRPVVPRGDLAADEASTVELFRENSPAVVYITTAKIGFDRRYFDERLLSQGTGSGFIWNDEGYVVTNDHVLADSNYAQVTLFDQSIWKAEVVGRASGKDLAVLKIDAPPDRLHAILCGRSDDLQVGQKVFAIGNPFGLDQSLTTGIISALDREISASEVAEHVPTKRVIDGVIQTDAAINPGNSGGPLLDSQGRLIGVNTAIYSPSGAYAGVGFAIPVDTVNRIVPQLIRHGRIIRPDIGIIPFRDQMARQLDLAGVLVRDVYPDSPATQVGIQPTQVVEVSRGFRVYQRIRLGDLIVAGNGEPIEDLDDWFSFLEKHQIGDRVTLTIVRELKTPQERKLDVEVTLVAPQD